MSIKHILFDLDGTLLPMVQDEFVRFYMPLLAKAYLKKGVEMDPKGFIGAVWKGYEAMVKNDGSRTNREAFWSYIDEFLPLSVEESEAIADAFYEDEFNQAKCTTQPTPLSDMVIKEAKKKGIEVYLATNPIFPRCATMNRIDWAGLDPEDFKIITTYEDHVYCKPNPEYFRQILEQFELDPSECLMVGNDVEEDLAIRALGVPVFLITDTMENKKNLPIDFGNGEEAQYYIGSADFMTRNTVKRVEVAAPVYSERLKKRLQDLFDLMLSDNKKARKEDAKGTYSVVECKGQPINSQELLYQEAYAKAAMNSSNQLEAAVQQTENKVIE